VIAIPGYSIVRVLGQGGMATVYLAVQQSLGREVALKVLAPALAKDATANERFLREAHIAARLHHPNIVAIHDVGVHEGTPYMAMAFEPAGTIAALAATGADRGGALRAVRDIAAALDYAHRQGVVHRDIKPENILCRNDGTAVLTDFGIARAAEISPGLTAEGSSVGTPHYMSPEQWRGETVDGRSDLYSLGVVLYQLLVGTLPYQGSDGWAVGMQHMQAPVPRLPAASARWQPLLDDLLAKEAKLRPQTGAEVVRRIDAILNAPTVAMPAPLATTVTNASLAGPGVRARAWWFALVAGVCVVLAAVWLRAPERQVANNMVTAVAPPSIAVLPFVDLSEGKDQDYFSDGLSEELLDRLAKLPQLRVAGRTSSFSFKGKTDDLRSIGDKLGVTKVLEGSVRKSGSRLRITAQLINVADGFHVWSQSFDRELTDVFAVQDEIAAAVVAALQVKLLPNQAMATRARHLPSPEAYDQYLMARQILPSARAGSVDAAVAAYSRAVALDPKFADAYSGLAMATGFQAMRGDAASAANLQRAYAAAETAIALDPASSDAYATRGYLRFSLDWNWSGAQADLDQAMLLDPRNARTLLRHGRLQALLGDVHGAIATTLTAAEIDPMFPPIWNELPQYYMAIGDYANARNMLQRAQSIEPNSARRGALMARTIGLLEGDYAKTREEFNIEQFPVVRLLGLALAEHGLGNVQASQAALTELTARHADAAAYQIAEVHAFRGETDAAFTWLDRAYNQRDPGLGLIQIDPLIANLRTDPRYAEFLRTMGFPSEAQ
jgi:TolB-like protein/tetratricopeptide (TPR) repeat protein